jgi:hypothetical protein
MTSAKRADAAMVRAPLAQQVDRPARAFLQTESGSAGILAAAIVVAVVWANLGTSLRVDVDHLVRPQVVCRHTRLLCVFTMTRPHKLFHIHGAFRQLPVTGAPLGRPAPLVAAARVDVEPSDGQSWPGNRV